MIHDLAVAQIERVHLLHLLVRQGEIPDVDVLLDALLMHRLRQYRHAALHVPPESDLRGGFSVLHADLREHRMREDAVISFRQRAPGLRQRAVLLHDLDDVIPRKERMQLELIFPRTLSAFRRKSLRRPARESSLLGTSPPSGIQCWLRSSQMYERRTHETKKGSRHLTTSPMFPAGIEPTASA